MKPVFFSSQARRRVPRLAWSSGRDLCLEFTGSESYIQFIFDDLVKNLLDRHPGEPRIMSGAGAGVHPAKSGMVITGFRLSPEIRILWNFDFLAAYQSLGEGER
jgi:hypothetical protein